MGRNPIEFIQLNFNQILTRRLALFKTLKAMIVRVESTLWQIDFTTSMIKFLLIGSMHRLTHSKLNVKKCI